MYQRKLKEKEPFLHHQTLCFSRSFKKYTKLVKLRYLVLVCEKYMQDPHLSAWNVSLFVNTKERLNFYLPRYSILKKLDDSRPLCFYFRRFNTVLIENKICPWLDSNRISVVLKANAPQPLRPCRNSNICGTLNSCNILMKRSVYFSGHCFWRTSLALMKWMKLVKFIEFISSRQLSAAST